MMSPDKEAIYERAGMDNRVGYGDAPALVVVDLQRAFTDPESPIGGDLFVGMLSFIGLLLLFLYSFNAPGHDGTLGWRWYDVVAIRLAGIAALVVAFVPTGGSGCTFGGGAVPRAFVREARDAENFPIAELPGEMTPVTGTLSWSVDSSLAGVGSTPFSRQYRNSRETSTLKQARSPTG